MEKIYMSINEVAATGILSRNKLLEMQREKELPCMYSGRKCLINFPALVEMLDKQSRAAVQSVRY